MRRTRGWVPLALACALLASPAPLAGAIPADRIWFCPGPGTIDYARLFDHPEEWAHARALVSVFKFYQSHTLTAGDPSIGPNTYDALARAGAFSLPKKWGMKIAIEAAAVKEYYCTPDASGMANAIDAGVASIRGVEDGGGTVGYIAMDEPFAAGRAPVCGGPSLEPTADRVAQYVQGVTSAAAGVKIGLIEAYPFSDEPSIERMLDLLAARGVPPAFLHVDADLNAIRAPSSDFTRDMIRLQAQCRARGIPFGIIIWGHDYDADALYMRDAARLVNAISRTFATWADMPDHLVFQSWAQTRGGLKILPANLAEDQPYTHTGLIWGVYRRLRGQTAPSKDLAIGR
jgi:hypothetical protein